MIPAILITFREIIEASLIVLTILGILIKLRQNQNIKTLWLATLTAILLSFFLVLGGSILGFKIHEIFVGSVEQIFEGTMMIVSAFFITWAVFWLHKYFANRKLKLLQKIKTTTSKGGKWELFLLVFTAVFREGFEIVLFLATIYLSSDPKQVLTGFGIGTILGILVSFSFLTASLKMPVYRTFQISSVLLVLFAAGFLARGVGELTEASLLPEFREVTIYFIPQSGTLVADLIKSVFGLSRSMSYIGLSLYAIYIGFMRWYIFLRKQTNKAQN